MAPGEPFAARVIRAHAIRTQPLALAHAASSAVTAGSGAISPRFSADSRNRLCTWEPWHLEWSLRFARDATVLGGSRVAPAPMGKRHCGSVALASGECHNSRETEAAVAGLKAEPKRLTNFRLEASATDPGEDDPRTATTAGENDAWWRCVNRTAQPLKPVSVRVRARRLGRAEVRNSSVRRRSGSGMKPALERAPGPGRSSPRVGSSGARPAASRAKDAAPWRGWEVQRAVRRTTASIWRARRPNCRRLESRLRCRAPARADHPLNGAPASS